MNEVIKAVDLTKIYNKEDKKKKEKISVNLNPALNCPPICSDIVWEN